MQRYFFAADIAAVTAVVGRSVYIKRKAPFQACICSWLQVVLTAAPTVSFQPHPEHDAQEFASITHLANRIESHGYYGGVRLLMVSPTQQLTPFKTAPHIMPIPPSTQQLVVTCSSFFTLKDQC
jgi:hypothetical protein